MASISKEKPQERSLDYEALLKEGIDLVQQYSGAIWTDYNHHDPGVTILEYLCFGITDIGYRCNFPISDLLYARENHIAKPENNAFLPPEQILPCAPLTADDYRKLIIDRIEGVVNAWVVPVLDHKENFKGLYDIGLQLRKESQDTVTPDSIAREVAHLVADHRNLCEDIRKIYFLEHHILDIIADVYIANDASPEQVLANIIHRVEHFLAPTAQYYDLAEMLDAGYSLNDLLDGPMPRHGFIKSDDFNELVSRINTHQITDLIIQVEGVNSVGQINLVRDNLPVFSNEINLPADSFLVLDDSHLNRLNSGNHPVKMFRNGQPVRPDLLMVKQILETLAAKDYRQFNPPIVLNTPPAVSEKDISDIGAYYSIQRFFPAVYGIGDYGLPGDADFRRMAQARQMKGFLAIFEIMFASYLQQLTQVKNLFSIGAFSKKTKVKLPENSPSYFTAFPFNIPDVDHLLDTKMIDPQDAQIEIQEKLNEIAAINDIPLDRRNEFLDHLLARFGESINGDFLSSINTGAGDDSVLLKKILIETKCRILQEYESLSRDRGQGFNYRLKAHVKKINLLYGDYEISTLTSENVSGLKKRLCAWMNIGNEADRSLTNFFPFDQFRKTYTAAGSTEASNGIPLSTILRYGKKEKNYQIYKYGNNDWGINFLGYFDSKPRQMFRLTKSSFKKAKEILRQFIEDVKLFDSYCKGFFVVEHLLLRPLRRKGDIIKLTIPHNNQHTVFWGIGFQDMAYLENLARDLIICAANRLNYEVLKDGDKSFLVIKLDDSPVMISSKSYDSIKGANKLCDQLAVAVNETLNKNPESFNNWISFADETVNGSQITNAFYDFRLSIVIPNWTSAFMDQDFRTQFKYMVAQHLPAHLRADLYWLEWTEMVEFEKDYFGWMEAKSENGQDSQEVDELAFRLTEKLMQLEDRNGIESARFRTEEEKQKNELKIIFSDQRINALLDKYGLPFLFHPGDLQIMEGIDAEVTYWLQKENIYTWSQLALAKESDLDSISRKTGRRNIAGTEKKWIEQARLCVSGDWDNLVEYQKKMGSTKLADMAERRKSTLYNK